MIIFIGGFIGSGQRFLAQSLADRLGYHLYTKNIQKMETLRTIHRSRGMNLLPTDDVRLRISQYIADELPLLAKMHKGLIIRVPFHRAKPRNFLYDAAKNIGDALMIWIDSPDEDAYTRKVKINNRILRPETVAKIRQKMREEFEPFTNPVLVFENTGTPEDAAKRLCESVFTKMKHTNVIFVS